MKMEILRLAVTILLAAVSLTFSSEAQRKIPSSEEMLSMNGAQGKEFWITIPPNEINPYPVDELEVYVASAYDTEVEVFDAAGNRTYKRKISAGQIRTLSDKRGETNWTWEVRDYEQVIRRAIRLRSAFPISVYVINSKVYSSDGYLAIPTSAWGLEYLVTTYYDFREGKPWACGFTVIAKENGTKIDILLRGTGEFDGRTEGGRRINTGQSYQISMEEGDVYYVKGNGQTRGIFDLSGTQIKSNKPIGLISSHERTTMPNLLINGNGRNHMVEMTPPTSTWGKKYVTVEYSREHNNGVGLGDVFRVFALQPSTRWKLKYYDKVTKQIIGQGGGVLSKAGEFADIFQAQAPTAITSGFSVWEADKPIFVMQYSCSSTWDGDEILDPFMINVVPEEQFITSTIFQTPTTSKFFKHRLNLIVWADSADTGYYNNLKSLEIDGKAVWNHPQAASPTLLFTRMPGTNFHWTTVDFGTEANSHRIKCNGKIKFGGYIYGFGEFDAYGWPAAAGFRPVSIQDTMPPLLKADSLCGDYVFKATELRNIPDPPRAEPKDSDQVETGVADIDTVVGANSYNYRLVLVTDQQFPRDPSYKTFEYRWEVIDKSKDAYCEYYVQDWADNFTYDTIRYFADKISFNPNPLKFGKIRLGTNRSLDLTLTNSSPGAVILTNARLKIGTYYSIIENQIPPIITIQPGQTHRFKINYDGRRETTDIKKDFDFDTLLVSTACGEFKVPVEGVAAIPRIVVSDFHAGTVGLNIEECLTGGLQITNPGSDTLSVTGISGYVGTNFTVSNPTTPTIPFIVLPRATVMFKNVCYKRGTVGSDSIEVTFTNNGDGPDSVSTWTGATEAPGPGIDGYNWLKRRVNTRHQALAKVYNTGNQVLTLSDVTFLDGSKYFPPGSTDANFVFKIGAILIAGVPVATADLSNGMSVDVDVEFRPGAVQLYAEKIIPVWSTPGVVYKDALLQGEGIVPQIETQGEAMTCAQTPENTPVSRDLVITNNGSMDLTVSRLAFAAGTGPEWQFGAPPPPPTFVVSSIAGGNVMRIPIEYTRPVGYNGGSVLAVEIDHDATSGTGSDTASFPPQSTTEQFIVGSCAGPDIEVTDIDFGRQRANCDDPELEFTIRNSGGGTKNLEITAITAVDADAGAFTLINIIGPANTPVTLPFSIPTNGTARVLIRFTPTEPNATPWSDRIYNARFHIENYEEGAAVELRPNTYAKVQGIGYVIPVTMTLSHNGGNSPVQANTDYIFSISGSSSDWTNAQLTAFVADVRYETRALTFRPGSVATTGTTTGWTIGDATIVPVDDTYSNLRFSATGPTPISSNGVLFTFVAKLLLGPNFNTNQDLSVDLGKPCLIPTTSGTSTEIVNCALTKRVIAVSGVRYSMSPVSPNPATAGTARFDFSIGIKAPVSIDVVGANGQVVATLVSEELSDGAYSLEFPTTLLGNGLYFVRIKSVDYTDSKQLVIAE